MTVTIKLFLCYLISKFPIFTLLKYGILIASALIYCDLILYAIRVRRTCSFFHKDGHDIVFAVLSYISWSCFVVFEANLRSRTHVDESVCRLSAVHIHHRGLLLPLSAKADVRFAVPRVAEILRGDRCRRRQNTRCRRGKDQIHCGCSRRPDDGCHGNASPSLPSSVRNASSGRYLAC